MQICQECVPTNKLNAGKPKILNALRRKKKRLIDRVEKLKIIRANPAHISEVQTKVDLVTYEIREAIHDNLNYQESIALSQIKVNPKAFFSYAKSRSSVKSEISMLVYEGEIISDDKPIADAFQRQFSSVFSDPLAHGIRNPDFDSPHIPYEMQEEVFRISDENIISAISEIKASSSGGPDDVPALLLKE